MSDHVTLLFSIDLSILWSSTWQRKIRFN